jgi:hypothetical protein
MVSRIRYAAVAVVGLGALIAAAAHGAASSQTVRVLPKTVFRTDRITQLAASGSRAAVVANPRRGCGRIVVWTAPGRRASHFALGALGCAGDGVDELALGGGEVAWTELGGGNDLELTVMAGRLPRGRTKQLDYEVNGDRAGGDPTGGWVGHLVGSGSSLAYNRWEVKCDRPAGEECGDGGDPKARVTDEQLLRIGAAGTTIVGGGPDVYALAAAGGGRFAVVRSDGVATLTASGGVAAFVPSAAPRAVGLTTDALVLEHATTLDLYDPADGVLEKSLPLNSAAPLKLVGVTARLALLRDKHRLVLLRLADGAEVTLSLAVPPLVDARVTDAGLFYAYNLRTRRSPGRIGFVPTAALLRAF